MSKIYNLYIEKYIYRDRESKMQRTYKEDSVEMHTMD